MKEKYTGLNIPKRHTLRHYMTLVGKLYGATEPELTEYIDEQLKANETNLDGAIDCFKSILPADKPPEMKRAVYEASKKTAKPFWKRGLYADE